MEREDKSAGAAVAQGPLRVVHDRIRGRLRVRVPALYRAPRVKARIERDFPATVGVTSVAASVLTGTVLVVFREDTDPQAVLNELAQLLQVPPPAQPAVERATAPSQPGTGSRWDRLVGSPLPKARRQPPVAVPRPRTWYADDAQAVLGLEKAALKK